MNPRRLCAISFWFEQLGVAGETNNEIDVRYRVDESDQFGPAEVSVAPRQDMGIGKVMTSQDRHKAYQHYFSAPYGYLQVCNMAINNVPDRLPKIVSSR